MVLRKAQIYLCQNEGCRAEIHVMKDSIEGSSNPRCCCGTEMKKPYTKPILKTIHAYEKRS
jgi:hypothetical protein